MILLVVDMQKCLVDEELYAYDTFIDRTARLIGAARKNRVEVIFVQHDAGPGSGLTAGDSGFEIADQVAPEKGEKVFARFGFKDDLPAVASISALMKGWHRWGDGKLLDVLILDNLSNFSVQFSDVLDGRFFSFVCQRKFE